MEYIQEKLPTTELLAQLAEEATELAQAALKLRRVYDGTNPTPTTYEDALGNLHEEIADVRLLLEILRLDTPHCESLQNAISRAKLKRWAERLRKNARTQNKNNDPARIVELEAELALAVKIISAQRDCDTCKHRPPEDNYPCVAAQYDCMDCDHEHCEYACRMCYNGNKWEWRGKHGKQ